MRGWGAGSCITRYCGIIERSGAGLASVYLAWSLGIWEWRFSGVGKWMEWDFDAWLAYVGIDPGIKARWYDA
jgi:hypothetical protein